MKLAISKIILFFLFLSFYTYLIIHFTTMRMIKNEALNNMINFELIQKLTEQNKSIESFLNSNIKMDIVSYNQNSLKLSNHMDIYYILSVLGSKERACDSILKDSNNIDIKEFIKNNCEKEKNWFVLPFKCEKSGQKFLSENGKNTVLCNKLLISSCLYENLYPNQKYPISLIVYNK